MRRWMRVGSAYGHITLTADVGLGQTLLQLTRHPKVTKLNLALSVYQNIRRLYVCPVRN